MFPRPSSHDLLRWLLFAAALGFALWVAVLSFCVWNDSTNDHSWLPFCCWAAALLACLFPCRGNPADVVMMTVLAFLLIGPVAFYRVWFRGEALETDHLTWLAILLTLAAIIRFRPAWSRVSHFADGTRRQYWAAESLPAKDDEF